MRNLLNCIIMLCCLLSMIPGDLWAQKEKNTMPPFDIDVIAFPGRNYEMVTVDIYMWVRNSHLQYLKNDTSFYARYQINLGIYDKDEFAILTKDSTISIFEKDYASTIDREDSRIYHFQYEMPPQDYLFKVRLFDLNSGTKREQEIKRKIQPFNSEQFQLSDVIILDSNELDSITNANILPPMRINVREKIYVYTELVFPDSVNEYEIEAKILQQGKSKQFIFKRKVSTATWPSRIILELTNDNMIRGVSQISVEAKTGELSTRSLKTVRFFQSFVDGEQLAGGSLNEMVEQLEYVARGDEWKGLDEAPREEKELRFKKYWERRDPTPNTPDNELFDEYYKRVGLSNQRFSSSKRDGWTTDRGKVYIIFGAPDTIERTNPYSTSFTSYEVWYYEDLREKFIFMDEYGFGNYRMISGNIY